MDAEMLKTTTMEDVSPVPLPTGCDPLPDVPAPALVKHAKFDGRMVILGFGSIGAGSLPLLLRLLDMKSENITIITAPDREEAAHDAAKRFKVNVLIEPLTSDNFERILDPLLGNGDFLFNVSVDVSSCALMQFCNTRSILYLDTVVEPWAGGYSDPHLSMSARSNYGQREEMLSLKRRFGDDAPTAISCHGANPGLVSHFVKQAMLNIARDTGLDVAKPTSRAEWAQLAHRLGVKAIHIAERDSQISSIRRKPGEFVNTWSVDGFTGEGVQPAELGWGSHEKALPEDGCVHDHGCGSAIFLNRPGCTTKVRSWTPLEGPYHGFLITHNESISISDYFTVKDGEAVVYRPTVHYAYHPCDDAVMSMHEFVGKSMKQPAKKRILMSDIVSGVDELGVLLLGHAKNAYWYGSQLSVEDARRYAECNSATSLQVTSAAVAATIWALNNPRCGIVEADEIDFEDILRIAGPFCEPLVGVYSDWTPLQDRGDLFEEDVDETDPFQFRNIRVM